MSLLFDTTPEEPTKKKTKKPKATQPAVAIAKPATRATPAAVAAALGRLDDGVSCADECCQSQCHDITEEDRGQWRLECCFCGTGQWVAVIKGHLKEKPVEFTFRDGRFAGQTIAEAATHQRGMDYLTWAAAEHPRQAVRESVKTWLDLNRPAV